jgi:hypothetical protein
MNPFIKKKTITQKTIKKKIMVTTFHISDLKAKAAIVPKANITTR